MAQKLHFVFSQYLKSIIVLDYDLKYMYLKEAVFWGQRGVGVCVTSDPLLQGKQYKEESSVRK